MLHEMPGDHTRWMSSHSPRTSQLKPYNRDLFNTAKKLFVDMENLRFSPSCEMRVLHPAVFFTARGEEIPPQYY